MSNSNLDLIFTEWKAGLKNRDRSAAAVAGNFDDLFNELKRANASFEEAHAILPKAIKAHLPPPGVAKTIYKNGKSNPKIAHYSEKEFVDQWNQDIADKGTAAFFDSFPRPKTDADDDGEPKVYGQMSAKEYRAQRRYADSFPTLDTAALERAMQRGVSYNPMEDQDLHNILGDKDGSAK
jgi:hypothetical protein